MRNRSIVLRVGVLAVLFSLAGILVGADPPDAGRSLAGVEPLGVADTQAYQYMVKYMCGPQGGGGLVAQGEYSTSINIHNYTTRPVRIFKRPAIGQVEYLPANPIGGLGSKFILARRTLIINCYDIIQLEGQGFISTEGMMHISMDVKLPVVAVYTVGGWDHPAGVRVPAGGASIHVKEYEPFIEP